MGQLIDATTEQAELRKLTGREDLVLVTNTTCPPDTPWILGDLALYQVRAGGSEYTAAQSKYDREREAKRWAS